MKKLTERFFIDIIDIDNVLSAKVNNRNECEEN